jgi:hypothetical protein
MNRHAYFTQSVVLHSRASRKIGAYSVESKPFPQAGRAREKSSRTHGTPQESKLTAGLSITEPVVVKVNCKVL